MILREQRCILILRYKRVTQHDAEISFVYVSEAFFTCTPHLHRARYIKKEPVPQAQRLKHAAGNTDTSFLAAYAGSSHNCPALMFGGIGDR